MRTVLVFLFGCLSLPGQSEPPGRQAFIDASLKYHEGDYDGCVAGYRLTISLHHEVPFSKMMIARCLALKGEAEKAIEALDEAAEFEFQGAQALETHEDFATLRTHARFAEIVAKVRSNNRPCLVREQRKQLNFWVGEWTVATRDGRPAGTSRIEVLEGGCIIRENWTSVGGGTGQSLNFYDRPSGLWRQIWMDPSGGRQEFSGRLIDGAMVIEDIAYTGGLKSILRMTLTPQPNGSVRQFAERSVDDGATWSTAYDFIYTRRE